MVQRFFSEIFNLNKSSAASKARPCNNFSNTFVFYLFFTLAFGSYYGKCIVSAWSILIFISLWEFTW